MQSPDWSHVANPSRCQFCRSEYHLSADELYPEPSSLQLALTYVPRKDRPGYQGHGSVIVGSSSRVPGQMDSIRWWVGGEDCWWTDAAAETIGVERQMSDGGGGRSTSRNGGSGSCFSASSDNSLELSDLEPGTSQIAGWRQSPWGRWNDDSVEESRTHDVKQVRLERRGTAQRLSGGPHRRSWTPTSREWVVRRRSDGSRYVGRRRGPAERRRSSGKTTHDRIDPARHSQPRSTSYQSPGSYDYKHGSTDDHSDVIRTLMTLDQRTAADDEDYSTAQWICSRHWTDSSCRIVAVI